MNNQNPKNWQKVKMEEIVDSTDYVANGSFASLKQNVAYKNEEDFALLIRSVDLKNGLSSRKVFINQNAYNFLKKTKLFGGEVIVTNVGEYTGEVFRCPKLDKPMSLGPNVVLLRAKNGNNNFVYYLLKSPFGQHKLHTIISGSGQPKFNKTDLRSLVFTVPLEDSQLKIASILSSFDDKIEVNNKIAKTLEEMAQALFKEWFVTKKKDSLEEKNIGDICETYGGGTPNTKEENYWRNGTVDWATPTDMTALQGPFIFQTEKKITETGLKKSSATLLPKGAILMTSRATVGVLAITKIPISTNQGFISVVCKERISNIFMYCWLKHNIRLIQGLATGSTFPEISRGVFRKIQIAIPDKQTLRDFNKLVEPMFEKVANVIQENQKLAALRDLLLPKLMRGEVRI